ncbi:hypothetical protein LOK49_Contig576G00002, partial [Camellia lanceoleosa]
RTISFMHSVSAAPEPPPGGLTCLPLAVEGATLGPHATLSHTVQTPSGPTRGSGRSTYHEGPTDDRPTITKLNLIMRCFEKLVKSWLLIFYQAFDFFRITPQNHNMNLRAALVLSGAALASHMDVDVEKLAFTGSTDTGKFVLGLAAKSNLKPVTLELGGKSPVIVCEDADVDTAVELAHLALFFNQGQCCCAGSRTFVHERVYDEFIEKAKALALKRVIDSEQFKKILKYIRSGIEGGATLESGGERFGSKGYYIQPTVFSNVQDNMLIAKGEILGPVQSILKFKDLDEVIRQANMTRYGLAAGVFTQNIDTANTLTRALKAGTVWINCFDIFDAAIPFVEYKMAGQGREKGIFSLNNYLQGKAVVSPLKSPALL